jgi:hypothetical protein
MRDYLPVGEGTQLVLGSEAGKSPQEVRHGPLTRKGDARSQRLKIACVPCNTGWMSVLQQKTKPILLPMLLGQQLDLNISDRKLLAAWLTMFMFVYATTAVGISPMSATQRTAFKENKESPEGWSFWWARFDGATSPATMIGFSDPHESWPVIGKVQREAPVMHLTFCGAGAVCFAAFSTNSLRYIQTFYKGVDQFLISLGFRRFWPAQDSSLQFPDVRLARLSVGDLWNIQNRVMQAARTAHSRRQ